MKKIITGISIFIGAACLCGSMYINKPIVSLEQETIANAPSLCSQETKPSFTNFQEEIDNSDVLWNSEMLFSYCKDVMNPEKFIEDDSIVIEATIGDILESEISPEIGIPVTPMNIVSYNVIQGNLVDKIDKIYYGGGIISVDKYINACPQQASKMNLDTMSNEEKTTKYMRFDMDSKYDYTPGATYVLVIKNNLDGRYFIDCNAYGTFTIESDTFANNDIDKNTLKQENKHYIYKSVQDPDNTTINCKNVKTNKTLILKKK